MRLARTSAVLAALALQARLESYATTMVYEAPPCGEKTEALCRALRISDPVRRAAEARAALSEALKSEDAAVLPAVAHAIGKLKYRLDLRPVADLLSEGCGQKSPRCMWQPEDADWALLRNGRRSERLEALERAIRHGTLTLGSGTTVQRKWAVMMAAEQGLEELRPLAEEYLSTLTEARVRKLEMTTAPALFELCAGAESRAEAPRWAALRIRAIPDEDFARRMAEEEGFRGAVLEMSRRVCEVDPLLDNVAPECSVVAEVAARHRGRREAVGQVFIGDGCGGVKPDDWREQFWCSSRSRALWSRSGRPAFPPLKEAVSPRRGDFRPSSLDPCSIPELPLRFRNTYLSDAWVKLTDLTATPARVVDPSVGIVGHRAGESVRLGIEVTDRNGRPKPEPLLVEVRIEGNGTTVLGPSDAPSSSCTSLLLPLTDPERAGFRLPTRREFVVTLGGRAVAAGLAPGASDGAPPVPWWRESGRLHVKVNAVDGDLDLVIPYLDEEFSLRPEAKPGEALAAFRRLEPEFSGRDRGAILDGNMEDKQVIVRGPLRAFLVFSEEGAKEDRLDVVCRSTTEGSPLGRVAVTARRIADSQVFIGALTIFPDGHPEPDTPVGRSISGPILKITVGSSNMSCGGEESR